MNNRSKTMQALVLTELNEVEHRDIPIPQIDGNALVRVDQAGICGTDVKIAHGKIPAVLPVVMGHEGVGEIVEPASAGDLPIGTRVIIDPAIHCGACDLCVRDKHHLCRRGGLLGRDMDGVFSEFVSAGEEYLHVVPDNVGRDAAALLQVLGTVVHAQRTIAPMPDATAVVVGLGVSGLLHVQLLAARGVPVIGITRSPWKRELAEEFGAAATAAPANAQNVVLEMTNGTGADVVIESVGTEATLGQSIELAGHAADVVVFGTITGGSEGLPYYQLYFKELTVYNPRAAKAVDYDTGIALVSAGKLKPEALVTARFPFGDAETALAATGGQNLKVVLDVVTGN